MHKKYHAQDSSQSDISVDSSGEVNPEKILPNSPLCFEPSGNAPCIDLKAPRYSKMKAMERRKKHLTNQHDINDKRRLYECCTESRIDELRQMLEGDEKYSVTEEVSKSGYYWTIIHYASHFGYYDVLHYIIMDFLSDHPDRFEIFNLQTIEGKSPLFCTILSCDINLKQKQQIIKLWFDTNMIDLKLRKQTGEDLLQIAKDKKLYDFIVEYCLRED